MGAPSGRPVRAGAASTWRGYYSRARPVPVWRGEDRALPALREGMREHGGHGVTRSGKDRQHSATWQWRCARVVAVAAVAVVGVSCVPGQLYSCMRVRP